MAGGVHQGGGSRRRPVPWRWMVLLSRFSWSFIALGIFKSLGVFFPYFMESFSANAASVGASESAANGVGLLTCGPFVGALIKVWSPRKLTIFGGIVAGGCLCAASFSSTMVQLAVWLSLSSVGLAFVQVSSVQPLMEYFPDDFGFANGISLAGGTTGIMTLPPLVEYLVDQYGWRSALGLMGALSFNYVVCGALLRPVDKTPTADQYRPLADGYDEDPSPTTPKSPSGGERGNRDKEAEQSGSFLTAVAATLRERFDGEVLTSPLFLTFQLVSVLEGMVFSMWHLFLIPQGVELGFDETAAAFLATFGGLGSLIGRMGHGIVVDSGLIKASSLFVLACLLFAVSTFLDPLAVLSYTITATLASLSGVAIGIIFPLMFVLMREIIGDKRTSAYGWLFVTHGLGIIIGGAIAGLMHDVTKSYIFVFLTMGGVGVTMAILVMLLRFGMYLQNRRK